MEENKNIVPVKAEIVKEKKKKHPVRNIIIAIVAVFFLSALVFGGDDSDSTPASNTKETQQEAQAGDTEEVETVEEEKTVPEPEKGESQVEDQPEKSTQNTGYEIDGAIGNSNYIHVGNSYKIKSNGSMNIMDAWYDGYENGTLHVLVEFIAGDEPLQVNYTNATLYVDDYEYPLMSGVDTAASYGSVTVGGVTYPTFVDISASGRKGTMVFLATFPDNLTESSDVEFDIGGMIFKINPLSVIHANDEAEAKAQAEEQARQEKMEADWAERETEKARLESCIGSMGIVCDGIYVCDYNSIGGQNEAYLEIMTNDANDETDEIIMIDCRDPESDGMPDNFSGRLAGAEDLGYGETGYIISDYNDVPVFLLTPTSKTGFNLEAIDENYREGITRFNGFYCNNEALAYFMDE